MTIESQEVDSFHLYSIEELCQLPSADWLIEGIIEQPAVGFVAGPSGESKTFVTLDWALSVFAGRPWQGREVKQGPVVYVVAEGSAGIPKRVKAWLQHNDVADVEKAFFVLEAGQLRTKKYVEGLLNQIKQRCEKPALIVLDTFAQCFVGGEENSAKEVGQAIAAARRLLSETGATVLLVHHTGKSDSDTERGSSALRGNADFMISVRKTAGGSRSRTQSRRIRSCSRPLIRDGKRSAWVRARMAKISRPACLLSRMVRIAVWRTSLSSGGMVGFHRLAPPSTRASSRP